MAMEEDMSGYQKNSKEGDEHPGELTRIEAQPQYEGSVFLDLRRVGSEGPYPIMG